jgi:hypothetical protein
MELIMKLEWKVYSGPFRMHYAKVFINPDKNLSNY